MYQGVCRFSPLQCQPERFHYIFSLQIFSHMITHDFSGEGIRDQTQVGRTAKQRKISDISNPDLLRLKGDNLFGTGLQQIRMPVKTMMTVGRFVVRPFYRHQESVFIQQAKQAVPPDIQRALGLSIQQIMQFTCADSWLTASDVDNKINDMSILLMSFIAPCIGLIPRLPAVSQELACTRNGYF